MPCPIFRGMDMSENKTIETNKKVLEQAVKVIAHLKYRNIFGTMGVMCRILSGISFNGHRAIYIPEGKEAEMLSGVTGVTTAFMTEAPPQIVIFNEMMDKLSVEGVFFVVAHELAHFAFLHTSRRHGRDPVLWNIYGDKQINQILSKDILPAISEKIRGGGKRGSLNMNRGRDLFRGPDDYIPFVCYTPDTEDWVQKYADESEEAMFEIGRKEDFNKKVLQKREDNRNSAGSGGPSDSGVEDLDNEPSQGSPGSDQETGESKQSGQGGGKPYEEYSAADVDNHMQDALDMRKKLEEKYGTEGKNLADKMGLPKDQAEQKRQQERSRVMLERAREEAKSSGARVDKYITESFTRDKEARAQTQFRVKAENAVKKALRGGTWERSDELTDLSKLSRIGEVQEFMGLTGQIFVWEEEKRDPHINLLTIVDTSGSVMKEEIQKNYLNEIRNLVVNLGCQMTVVSADTESRGEKIVLNRDNFKDYEEKGFDLSGGGGTDMLTPLAKELAQAESKYNMAIILSDGGAESFTRKELLLKMEEFTDKRKYPNGHTAGDKPYVCMLNTRPMYDNRWSENFGTFSKEEFEVFTLNTGSDIRIDVSLGNCEI